MERWWIFAVDIAVCTLVLRIIIGWLLAYPRLIRLLIVLVIVLLLGFTVNALELPLAGLLVVLLLVPVVVILFLSFLPELGRVYQAASRGNLFRPRIFRSEEILPDLAEALIQLKERRMGALIVFPGSQDEDVLVSGGEEVDAKVNRSLLLSIFDPHCPRHDGAAVIRNNRLIRIGAVLPLASAEGAEAHHGTRHLAAIGLSERTDGHILVVSEERGVISHAHDGRLEEIDAPDAMSLKDKLYHLLGEENGDEESRRKWSLPFFLWGMAFLLAAVGSWQVEVIKEQFVERYSETVYFQSMDASIQYTLDPARQFVANWETTSARLDLRIPEAIQQIQKQPSILVDLKNKPFGKTEITLQGSMVSGLPSGAVVQGFEPETIVFNIAEVKLAEVPLVMPEISGLPEGWKVLSKNLNRETLKVKIRDIKWKNNRKFECDPVDLSEVVEGGAKRIVLQPILPATVERVDEEPVVLEIELEVPVVEEPEADEIIPQDASS